MLSQYYHPLCSDFAASGLKVQNFFVRTGLTATIFLQICSILEESALFIHRLLLMDMMLFPATLPQVMDEEGSQISFHKERVVKNGAFMTEYMAFSVLVM